MNARHNTRQYWILVTLPIMLGAAGSAVAQGLNWEGQTGALITPFAYTAGAARGFGKPELAFHYLDGGKVIGSDYQLSVTEGVARRFELGYTGAFSSSGSSPYSYLFSGGFSEFHGKLNFISENAWHSNWVPAISVGALGRTGIQRVGYYLEMHDLTTQGRGSSATNGDFYIVATKVISQLKLPLILSLGDKVTNASLLGIAGDAPHWQGRLFGTFGFIVRGPAKSSVIFGAEALQEPHHIEGLAAFGGVPVTVPTSLSYFVRVVPRMQRTPLQVDFAVAQLAGKIAPTLDVQARAQMGMGISYHF